MQSDVTQGYKARISVLKSEYAILKKEDSGYAALRLFVAILGTAIIIVAFQSSIYWGIGGIFVLGIIFFLIFIRHENIKEKIKVNNAKSEINKNEISCLESHRNNYYNGLHFKDLGHIYTEDLDVFGEYSLFNLTNRSNTFYGNKFLAEHLSELDDINTISLRRESIKELTSKIDWRQDLSTLLHDLNDDPEVDFSEDLSTRLDGDFAIFDGTWWKIIIYSVPIAWIILLTLWTLDIPNIYNIAVLFAVLIFILYFYFAKKVNEIQFAISSSNNFLDTYTKAFRLIFNTKWESTLLQKLTKKDKSNENAIDALDRLKKIMDKLDYRLNMIAGIILNFGLLWDFRIVRHLSQWKKDHHSNIKQLFIILGKVEALSSLATWAYNHPDYVYASIDDNHLHINAKGIFHPLMKLGECVPNDFSISKKDHINVITGSNMSGKSTFLRTLGINMILGYAGTVSAGKELDISLAKVITYMRIKDALEENVSTFKAELDRVKLILGYIEGKEKCFCLIDEMLRGTNSKDKLKGSIAITKKLISFKSYALIATHDIKLAELSRDFPDHIKNYYFDIEFKDEDLIFDYKIKPGICSNFNASYLLEKIGIS